VYVPMRMRERGHTVEVCIANAAPIASAWAAENGVAPPDQDGEFAVVLERVRRFAPDVLYIGPMFGYYGSRLAELRRYCRKVVTWIAAPLRPFMNVDGVDCIVTSHENLAVEFRKFGVPVRRMLPAFESRMLEMPGLTGVERDVPLSFIGSLSWAHADRMTALAELRRAVPVQTWILKLPLWSRTLLRPQFYVTVLRYLALRRGSAEEVFGLDMFRVLARSVATFNMHIGIAGGLAGNQRMFEATGVGALLLTEAAPNIREMFEPDVEVVCYRDNAELCAQARRILADPDAAQRIARAGQQRTCTQHSAVRRAAELEAIFQDLG